MGVRVCVYEDDGVAGLGPLALTRPACDLWCGASSLLARQCCYFGATEVLLSVRPALAEWSRFLHPSCAVNDLSGIFRKNTILVNARWLPPAEPKGLTLEEPHVGVAGDQVAYVVVPDVGAGHGCTQDVAGRVAAWKEALPEVPAGGHMIDYPWDLLHHNAETLTQDFSRLRRLIPEEEAVHPLVVGSRELLIVYPGARVEPLAVVDTTRGPVLIDQGAVVQAFSRLEGPCYIGMDTQVLGARVRGSTLGPRCRVGGEVEASIFQGHANKAHEGFLGHSFVGEWVNLGAGTQVSDLRNDYASVRVPLAGGEVDTGLTKVGAFLGDHTKTGLGTLLNTGTVAGAFCQLLPWGTLLPREIPSFCTVAWGELQERADFGPLFATAACVMRRRGRVWTDAHKEFFLSLFEQTASERRRALCLDTPRRVPGTIP